MSFQPTAEQLAVIESDASVLVVLGGAGTGKTTTALAAATKRLEIADSGRSSGGDQTTPSPSARATARVLFLSFSRTSVSQVTDRAATILGPYRARIDVSTFHGQAWRILNDFGRHFGVPSPLRIRTPSEVERGAGTPGITFDELVPEAFRILAIPTVGGYYSRRYCTVICDEFQDTDDSEWQFMQAIAPQARRILLGDINQCIYANLKNIDPVKRVEEAGKLPGAEQICLQTGSYRDPSGIMAAAAQAARERRFNDSAIKEAVQRRILNVHRAEESECEEVAVSLMTKERLQGHSVNAFAHTNVAVDALSARLTGLGIHHERIRRGETLGDAISTQFAFLKWGVDRAPGPRDALARYARSIHSAAVGQKLADAIERKSDPIIEPALSSFHEELLAASGPPIDLPSFMLTLRSLHARLGFQSALDAWVEANRWVRYAARLLETPGGLGAVDSEIERVRRQFLTDSAPSRTHSVQLMNLHQTKGREADVTVLVLRSDDFHGYEKEPFQTGSRLLYVCLTRARIRAHIVCSANTHDLWRPLIDACMEAKRSEGM